MIAVPPCAASQAVPATALRLRTTVSSPWRSCRSFLICDCLAFLTPLLLLPLLSVLGEEGIPVFATRYISTEQKKVSFWFLMLLWTNGESYLSNQKWVQCSVYFLFSLFCVSSRNVKIKHEWFFNHCFKIQAGKKWKAGHVTVIYKAVHRCS